MTAATALPRTLTSCRGRPDDFMARRMRKPNRTKLPAVAALLLSSDLRLLVRHVRREVARYERTTGLEIDQCELSE